MQKTMAMWLRLAGMVALSTAIMFVLMYQLVYSADHVTFSINRLIASLVMGAVMTVIMVAFMWRMLDGRIAKIAVVAVAGVLGVGLLVVNRSQAAVGDVAFMDSMIPHHSIAINNAEKADITDPRVRKLADEIIASQVKEIAEMKALLADIDAHGSRGTQPLPPIEATVDPQMQAEVDAAVR